MLETQQVFICLKYKQGVDLPHSSSAMESSGLPMQVVHSNLNSIITEKIVNQLG